MAAVSPFARRRTRVGIAAAAIAIATAAWMQHTDSPTRVRAATDVPTTVRAASESTVPAAVQRTFIDAIRAGFDARGPLDVDYVQSTKGTAEQLVTFGDLTLVDVDKPVYVLFLSGNYRSVGGGCGSRGGGPVNPTPPGVEPGGPVIEAPAVTGGCEPPAGGIVAIIGVDGQSYLVAGYGNTVPDLSKLGTPSTTVVDVGA